MVAPARARMMRQLRFAKRVDPRARKMVDCSWRRRLQLSELETPKPALNRLFNDVQWRLLFAGEIIACKSQHSCSGAQPLSGRPAAAGPFPVRRLGRFSAPR